jgi:hypothetical protein
MTRSALRPQAGRSCRRPAAAQPGISALARRVWIDSDSEAKILGAAHGFKFHIPSRQARGRSPSHESYYCVFKFRVRVSGKSTVALERFPGQITQAQLPG